MNNTIPDHFRKLAIGNIFSTATFQNCWTTWQPEINNLLGTNFSENQILNLGDHLSDIFKSTGSSGRGQGELSAGGTAWESLVCWYINLCSIGSRVVAFKKMSLVPKPIQDAITVNYGNFACNTESDITIIIFPDLPEYNTDILNLIITDKNNLPILSIVKNEFNLNPANYLTDRDFNKFEIGIIQCKTNWNDNAQIPMLWDMIYSAGGFRGRNITIGRNGYSIQSVQSFTYSFVTVPSNKNALYKSNSVSVKRVTNLSGGNYWGKATSQNVAKSLKEIFTNNFQSGSKPSFRDNIRNNIPELTTNHSLSYFGI
jgi:hypothetical protein